MQSGEENFEDRERMEEANGIAKKEFTRRLFSGFNNGEAKVLCSRKRVSL